VPNAPLFQNRHAFGDRHAPFFIIVGCQGKGAHGQRSGKQNAGFTTDLNSLLCMFDSLAPIALDQFNLCQDGKIYRFKSPGTDPCGNIKGRFDFLAGGFIITHVKQDFPCTTPPGNHFSPVIPVFNRKPGGQRDVFQRLVHLQQIQQGMAVHGTVHRFNLLQPMLFNNIQTRFETVMCGDQMTTHKPGIAEATERPGLHSR